MSSKDAPLPAAPHVPGAPPRMLIVRSPYYTDVIAGMEWGAARILNEAGVAFEVLDVAGCIGAEPALALVRDKFVGGLRLPGDETGDAIDLALLERDRLGQAPRRSENELRDRAAAGHGPLVGKGLAAAVAVQHDIVMQQCHHRLDILSARGVEKLPQQGAVPRTVDGKTRSRRGNALTRAAKNLPAGRDVAVDDVSDLLEGDVEGAAQHEHHPLGRRQPLEHDEQRERNIFGVHRCVG